MRKGNLGNIGSHTEAKMESPHSKAGDHTAGAGVSMLKMGDVMKLIWEMQRIWKIGRVS
jgi:hypothetical protein